MLDPVAAAAEEVAGSAILARGQADSLDGNLNFGTEIGGGSSGAPSEFRRRNWQELHLGLHLKFGSEIGWCFIWGSI